jgi:L-fuconolactonase
VTPTSVRRPTRVVDAHVHLWDPANTEWYPYLSGRRDIGMGDVSGMARRFDVATHAAESAGWNVEKLVNVAAATGRHSVEETLAMDERAGTEGHPDAIIGGLPPTDTAAEAIALLERQARASRFRGVRPMGAMADPLPAPEVLRALADRGLVFEVMAHPDRLVDAARGLAGFEELTVVVEHTGWPRADTAGERALWTDGIAALAAAGPNVVCKVSGLAMPLGSVGAEAFRPWVEQAIETFGVARCLFASNFPVDGLHGTFDALYSAYAEVVAGLGDHDRDALFATNAERVYRC